MRAAGLDFQNSNLELQNSRLTRVVTFTGPRTGYRQQDLPSRAQRAALSRWITIIWRVRACLAGYI